MDAGAISVKEIADLLLAARGRIDFYWNFYLAVVVAVVGWLLSRRAGLTRPLKLLVSIIYLVADTMNLAGLYGAYTLAEALRTDLLRHAGTAALADTRLLLEGHSFLAQRPVAIAVHLVVATTVVLAVWFARLPGPAAGGAQEG